MDRSQIAAINAHMEDLIASLLPSTPIFMADLLSHNVISLDERDTVDSEPSDTATLNTLIALLKTKNSAWNVAMEFLRKNHQSGLAERLNKAVEQSNLHQSTFQLGETEANFRGTSTLTVKKPKGPLVKFADYLSGSSSADDYISVLKSLAKRSKKETVAQLLPDVVSLMQIYPNKPKVQLECIRLIQTFLPQNLSEITAELKAKLVETILTCLQSNFNDESTVRSCTVTLAKLEVFSDPIEKFKKTVEILLKIISNPEMTSKAKRSTMWLLSGISWGLCENRKNLVSQMGGVEQICEVIRQQLNNPTYDRTLEFSWICLVNLCVVSHENKKQFLSAGGIDLFHRCYEWVLSRYESVPSQLVSQRNFDAIWKILIKFNDNVAISYRCVRIFANFLSDTPIIWPLDSPTAEEVANLINETINKWKLDTNTNFSWDTFHPYLDNLQLHTSPFTDLLWVWTFANLTTIDASNYCRMLSEEGGVEILTTEVIRHPNSSFDSIRLALVAIDNVKRWESTATQR